jgi:hypothetical protein
LPLGNEEQQQPHMKEVPTNEATRSQKARKSAIPDNYQEYVREEFQM